MKYEKKTVYVSSVDGREFASVRELKEYEASAALIEYFANILPSDESVQAVVDAIRVDVPGLIDALKPLRTRQTRQKRPAFNKDGTPRRKPGRQPTASSEGNGGGTSRSPF